MNRRSFLKSAITTISVAAIAAKLSFAQPNDVDVTLDHYVSMEDADKYFGSDRMGNIPDESIAYAQKLIEDNFTFAPVP